MYIHIYIYIYWFIVVILVSPLDACMVMSLTGGAAEEAMVPCASVASKSETRET